MKGAGLESCRVRLLPRAMPGSSTKANVRAAAAGQMTSVTIATMTIDFAVP